jgi:DNA transposition AAA+ family ATPase
MRYKTKTITMNDNQNKGNSQLLAEVKALMEAEQISGNALSKLCGISGASVSQWLGGIYPANPKELEKKISAWLQRRREVDALPLQGVERFQSVVKTVVYNQVTGSLRQCHLYGKIGVVTSPSGTGKTTAIRDYVAQNPGSIAIDCHPTFPMRSVLQEIAKQGGIEARGNVHEVLMAICDKLKGSGKVIILDEAEHLKPTVLDVVRRIYDLSGVGIVYVGLPRFAATVRGLRGEYQYIWNRCRVKREVQRGRKEIVADLVLLIGSVMEDPEPISSVIADFCGGDIRQAEDLFFTGYSAALKSAEPLNEKILVAIARKLELKRGGVQ